MEISNFPIAVVIALLPGILATITIKKLTLSGSWDNFKVGLYTVVYSGVVYAAYFSVLNIIEGSSTMATSSIDEMVANIKAIDIVLASIISVVIGIFVAYASNQKFLFKFAQKIGITNKFGDEDLYYEFMRNDINAEVYIKDIDNNLTYHGYVTGYSQSKEARELELVDVIVYSYNDSIEAYRLKSFYLAIGIGDRFMIEVPNNLVNYDSTKREEE
ncbi:hypothetical protein [Lewinella sp. IMCC34191]|uniref:hypothetical protein n=1 Tax=Lewinella sp. IMCC34191 TaxID=2259172 RepID=UPI000E234E5A|nr:hypothetical protein [Lewinella sp. IMCC34191]